MHPVIDSVDFVCPSCGFAANLRRVVLPVHCPKCRQFARPTTPGYATYNCRHRGPITDFQSVGTCHGGDLRAPLYRCDSRGLEVLARPFNGFANCSQCLVAERRPTQKRYVTAAALMTDTLALCDQLPRIADVVGIVRSGMIPAALIASQLGARLWSCDITRGTLKELGHGFRLAKVSRDADGATLVVDDSAYSGRAMLEAVKAVKALDCRPITLAVYVNASAARKVDLHGPVLEQHLFEWNLGNAPFNGGTGFDIDGLLCRDFTPAEDDDGPRYQTAMEAMTPTRWQPRRPVDLVSARLERYRGTTLAWLKRHNLAVRRLVLGPWRSKAERERADVAAWKAEQIRRLRLHTFVESCPVLAQSIHELTGITVVCPPASRAWIP